LLTRRIRRRPYILLRLRLAWRMVRSLCQLLWWRLIPRLIRASLSALVISSLHVVAQRGWMCAGRVQAILPSMLAIVPRSVGLVECPSTECPSTARIGARIAAVGHTERAGSATLAAAAAAAGRTAPHRSSDSTGMTDQWKTCTTSLDSKPLHRHSGHSTTWLRGDELTYVHV
jgi:hypothetical protein